MQIQGRRHAFSGALLQAGRATMTLTMTIRQICLAAMLLAGSLVAAAGPGPLPRDAGAAAEGWRVVPAAGSEHSGHAMAAVGVGELEIAGFWARATLPGQPAAGGYLTITSKAGSDRLLSASSPSAGKVEIHEMKIENEVMVMRPVEGALDIPAGGTVELKPGGLHLMFLSLPAPFKEGETVPVTLEFEKAGAVELILPVKAASGHSAH